MKNTNLELTGNVSGLLSWAAFAGVDVDDHEDGRGGAVEVLTPFIFSQKPPDHNSISRHLKGLDFALETKVFNF